MRNNRRDLNTWLPQNIYNAMERHPEIAQAFEDEREMLLDTAELKLSESVSTGEPWAICFYLKTQGRSAARARSMSRTGSRSSKPS